MSEKMCAHCGLRRVSPANEQPGDYRNHQTKYCGVCRPIVVREQHAAAMRALRVRRREARTGLWKGLPGDLTGKPCQAKLKNIGADYLALKLNHRLIPADHILFDFRFTD